jgi:hypothetical protein
MRAPITDRIIIDGRNGAFGAYVARPNTVPAPAVVVLHEVFGVNTGIRKHCDELADQGFLAVAPDLFWHQEPDVDLSVTCEADWQHGLRLNQAYARDHGAPRRPQRPYDGRKPGRHRRYGVVSSPAWMCNRSCRCVAIRQTHHARKLPGAVRLPLHHSHHLAV